MIIPAREIEKIRQMLAQDKYPSCDERAQKIEFYFRSEWLPEYMAGALAAGQYATEKGYEHLKEFLFTCLQMPVDGISQKGNIHLFRHALIALPVFLKKLPENDEITVRTGKETRALTARLWRDYIFMHMANTVWQEIESELIDDSIKNDYLFSFFKELCRKDFFENCRGETICKLQNDLNKKNDVYQTQKKQNRDLQGICNAIEQIESRLSKLKNLGLPVVDTMPLEKRADPIAELGQLDPWSLSSLYAGLCELADTNSVDLFIGFAYCLAKKIHEGKEKRKGIVVNLPLLLLVLANRYPAKHDLIKSIAPMLEHTILKVSGNNMDGCLYTVYLAELMVILSSPSSPKGKRKNNHVSDIQIVLTAGELLKKHSVVSEAMKKAFDDFFKDKNKETALRILHLSENSLSGGLEWESMDEDIKKSLLNILTWIFYFCPIAVKESGSFRDWRRLDRIYHSLENYRKNDDLFEYFIRLLKECFIVILHNKEEKALKATDKIDSLWLDYRKMIYIQFVHILPILEEWKPPRTIGKDLGTLLVRLLEAAEKCTGHKTLRSLLMMAELARIDEDVAEEALEFCRSKNIKNMIEILTISEKLLMEDPHAENIWSGYLGVEKKLDSVEEGKKIEMSDLLKFFALGKMRALEDTAEVTRKDLLQKMDSIRSAFMFLISTREKIKYSRQKGFERIDPKNESIQEYDAFHKRMKYSAVVEWEKFFITLQNAVSLKIILQDSKMHSVEWHLKQLNIFLSYILELRDIAVMFLSHLQQQVIFTTLDPLCKDLENKKRIEEEIVYVIEQNDDVKASKLSAEYVGKNDPYYKQLAVCIDDWRCSRLQESENEDEAIATVKKFESVGMPEYHDMALKLKRWMYNRMMLNELSTIFSESKPAGWKVYRNILKFWSVLLIILVPYVCIGFLNITNLDKNFSAVWIFSGYMGFLNILFLVTIFFCAVIRVSDMKKKDKTDSHKTLSDKNNEISTLSMFLPKMLGLIFIAFLGLGTSDEIWHLAAATTSGNIKFSLFVIFFPVVLYFFIRKVLLRDQNITDQSTIHRRALGILSIAILQSFIIVSFFGGHWSPVFKDLVEDVYHAKKGGNSTGSESVDLEDHPNKTGPMTVKKFFDAIFPYESQTWSFAHLNFSQDQESNKVTVYPRIILFWTMQTAFAGVVLQLFMSKEPLT